MGTYFNILSVSLSDMSERQLQTVRYFPKNPGQIIFTIIWMDI